jgi:hypothetical protein
MMLTVMIASHVLMPLTDVFEVDGLSMRLCHVATIPIPNPNRFLTFKDESTTY